MTLGDIIAKILEIFGIKPARERKLRGAIDDTRRKIAEMDEDRSLILRTNAKIAEVIADLRRKLQVETIPQNQKLIMDEMDEQEKELDRKTALSEQMTENISTQRIMLSRYEQLLEQLRHGADPVMIEMLTEEVANMEEMRKGAKDGAEGLDVSGSKSKSRKASGAAAAKHAARLAEKLGTAVPAQSAPANHAPSTPAAPAPAAPETAPDTPAPTVAAG